MTLLHSANFPIELTNGNNGRGCQWFSSARERQKIEKVLRAFGHVRRHPFAGCVALRITRILAFRQSRWDADSWQRGNLKEIIDALVVLNWFIDDGPDYIEEIRFNQVATKPRPMIGAMRIEVHSTGG